MSKSVKFALIGFIFGTLGLYILSAVSLFSSVVEFLSAPILWPGRTMTALLVGPNGSDLAVFLLTIFNGVLYALIFTGINTLITRLHSTSSSSANKTRSV